MIVFPNCKINLGLHILNKRPDGFHNLETVFYPVALQDALEIIRSPSQQSTTGCSVTGININLPEEDNICIKAYHLLKKDFPDLPVIVMHLHKTIPIGAGIGGGSADGAYTLLLINNKFNLKLSEAQLIHYASQLGSDCAFFIKNKPCFATGRGEILEELILDLSAYSLVLVNPQIHINTGWAFSQLNLHVERIPLRQAISQDISIWKEQLTNDFEVPIFKNYPEIKAIKETLYQQGAVYASMSGSGSTVYGLFEKGSSPELNFPAHYFVKTVN